MLGETLVQWVESLFYTKSQVDSMEGIGLCDW